MKVRMKVTMGGVNVMYLVGQEYALPDSKAELWIKKELAEAVEDKVTFSDKSDFRKKVKTRK
jgi:hypothetical protein